MAAMSSGEGSRPQATRSITQSTPENLSERAEPGRPMTRRSPSSARKTRLPGSTGMPKRVMRPPAAATAAGATSARSEVAEPVRISTISPADSASAASSAAVSCGVTRSKTRSMPSAVSRVRIASAPLATTFSGMPGVRVRIRPAVRRRTGFTATAVRPASRASAAATAASGAA